MSQERLGELLTDLKERSGYSYALIARKARMSKSAVHRYCAGQSVPQTFGAIESIALACGADRAAIKKLYAAWSAAAEALPEPDPQPEIQPETRPETQPGTQPGTQPEPRLEPRFATGSEPDPKPPAAEPDPATALTTAPAPQPAKRRWIVATAAAAAVLLVAAATTIVLIRRPDGPAPGKNHDAQQISGPAWTMPPAAVPRTLFGATLNSASGTMPGFPLGAVRLWDSETRWSQVEPGRGAYDWRTLDGLVEGARRAGLPAMYVAGGTPAWAAPDGAHSVYPEGARSAPPDDLSEWDAFVRTLVQRYRGRIEAYELWVLGNDKRMYTGTPETLVAMTRRASSIIRSIDPKATVVCPGMGNLWTPEGRQALLRFAELGGYDHCDVAGIKLYQQTAADPPETMLDLLGTIDRLFHEAEVHPRLWNTGTTYTIALQQPLDSELATAYAVRFFLVGLYARNFNLERMYFYNWGGTKIPIVLQADGGEPTAAALAVGTLQGWLSGARSTSCGHGVPVGLPGNVWQCRFLIGGHSAEILWTQSGAATVPAPGGVTAVRHLDGTADHPGPGAPLAVGAEPIFVEYA